MDSSTLGQEAGMASIADRVLQSSEASPSNNLAASLNASTYQWPKSHFEILKHLPSPWFEFEANHSHVETQSWFIKNRHLSIYFGLAYFVLLFAGRRIMANRQPYSLRGALALWNVFMAVFSIAVTVRIGPYFLRRVLSQPLQAQVCLAEYAGTISGYEPDPVLGYWHYIFVFTKPMEFIDTLFIVLRKQHLHFLHWYHHITVVILCWYTLGAVPTPANAIFYVALNGFVHSVMYSYYCMRSARISVPRPFQMSITVMQILQMVVGMFINFSVLSYRLRGSRCDVNDESIYLPLVIYGSYFYLFSQFFYNFYLGKKTAEHGRPAPSSRQAIKVD